MPALAPFKAFRRGLGIDPRREVAAPARCPKCGKPVAPLWTPPAPEIVDASGFQVKGGSGFAIKPGQGFVLAADTTACCCSSCCNDCTAPPNTYTLSFSGVTLATNCCRRAVNPSPTGWWLIDITGSLGTYCVTCTGNNTCAWSTTAAFPGNCYQSTSACGRGTDVSPSIIDIGIQRIVSTGKWAVSVGFAFDGITSFGSVGNSLFSGQANFSANDCGSPPTISNGLGTIVCSSTQFFNNSPCGTGGTCTITPGC